MTLWPTHGNPCDVEGQRCRRCHSFRVNSEAWWEDLRVEDQLERKWRFKIRNNQLPTMTKKMVMYVIYTYINIHKFLRPILGLLGSSAPMWRSWGILTLFSNLILLPILKPHHIRGYLI